MITITPNATEKEARRLSPAHLTQAAAAIHEDGFVVLNDVIDHDHLDALHEKMLADSHELLAAKRWGGAGRRPGHLQQRPPPFAPYVFRDIVANPFAIQVSRAVLGEGCYNRFYSGNTNCPGSEAQHLHMDNPHLWPNLPMAHPPASLVLNIGLMDIDESVGSIELWPGSQHVTRATKQLEDQSLIDARREVAPPMRGNTRKGSLLIRDIRVWHRGVPNESNTIRHMIALIHNISWLKSGRPVTYNTGVEQIFEDTGLAPNERFTDEPLDYLFATTL